MSDYQVPEWKAQLEHCTASNWKEPLYRILRPGLNLLARRHLQPETLRQFRPDMVLGTRGMPLVARRRWAAEGKSLAGKTVLIQGTGTGWDLFSWAEFGPAKLIGSDLFQFDAWPEIVAEVEKTYGIPTEFHACSMTDMAVLPDASVDLCASDAVFEHVQDLRTALEESYRVLKPGGTLYATYGPLWYVAGGDHYSGRGGSEHVFNHVLLDPPDYQQYFQKYKVDNEDFQNGGRYVELDLFSRLRTEEYLDLFAEAGFEREGLILEVSPVALKFQRDYPEAFAQLRKRHPQCTVDDFLIQANFVRLRKPVSAAGSQPRKTAQAA